MAQNFDHLQIAEAKRLAQTEAGQKLIALLQSRDSGQLQAAASSGDYGQLKKSLEAFMSTPEAQVLLRQLENGTHE